MKTTHIKITASEAIILQAIAQNEMNTCNYGIPENWEETQTWSNCLDACTLLPGMEYPKSTSVPGIVSSLVKKELVSCAGEGNDSVIGHTPLGFEVWKEQVLKG